MKAAVSSLRSWRVHSLKKQSFGRGATKLAENGASPLEILSHTRAKQFRQLRKLAVSRVVCLRECLIGDLPLYEQFYFTYFCIPNQVNLSVELKQSLKIPLTLFLCTSLFYTKSKNASDI